jgi:hypothetical protein
MVGGYDVHYPQSGVPPAAAVLSSPGDARLRGRKRPITSHLPRPRQTHLNSPMAHPACPQTPKPKAHLPTRNRNGKVETPRARSWKYRSTACAKTPYDTYHYPIPRYTTATGPMQLKFLFNNIAALDIFYSDSLATSIPDQVPTEDELLEAKQYICGRLFREVWSDDIENGFPLPRGCYYKKYGNTREVFLLFEPRNGLRPGKNYQVVLNGAAYHPHATV